MSGEKQTQGRSRVKARSAARLAAVQALYQIEVTNRPAISVVREFASHRLGSESEEGELIAPDEAFFEDVVRGTSGRLAAVDEALTGVLSADWPMERLNSILRALLRAGAYEFMSRPDVPAKVVINEYVDVAHAFFSGQEPPFANGVLNTLARRLRPAEFTA